MAVPPPISVGAAGAGAGTNVAPSPVVSTKAVPSSPAVHTPSAAAAAAAVAAAAAAAPVTANGTPAAAPAAASSGGGVAPMSDGKDSKEPSAAATAGAAAAYPYAALGGAVERVLPLYALENYTFGEREPLLTGNPAEHTVKAKFDRLRSEFAASGTRRTVEAVLLVHNHNHPHVLLLQYPNGAFKLPSGRVKPGQTDEEAMKQALTHKLAAAQPDLVPDWGVSDLVAVWHRPAFDGLLYPYVPPHISKPKETRKLCLVLLPEKCYFAVPRDMRLIAVPLFELNDHAQRYGSVIAALPAQLSRFTFAT